MLRLFVLCLLFLLPLEKAAAADLFTVENIAVSASALNATGARTQAIADAEVQAFQQLIRRITPLHMRHKLPVLPYEKVHPLVQSFEIQNEQISKRDYTATLTMIFHPDAVKSFLSSLQIPYSTEPGPRIMVLPLLNADNRLLLWETENVWRHAWDKVAAEAGMVQLIVPLGELDDITKASPQQVLNADFSTLASLAKKYDVNLIFIPFATYQTDTTSGTPLLAMTTRLLTPGNSLPRNFTLPSKPNDSQEAILDNAALEAVSQLELDWSTVFKLEKVPLQKRIIAVPIGNLQEWITLRQQLAECHFLQSLRIVSLAPTVVEVEVGFIGELATLKEQFAKEGFTLEEEPSRLTLRRGER